MSKSPGTDPVASPVTSPSSPAKRGTRSQIPPAERPVWQYPDISLTVDGKVYYCRPHAANNGSWRIKFKGSHHHFGSWRNGTQIEALSAWRDRWPSIVRGVPYLGSTITLSASPESPASPVGEGDAGSSLETAKIKIPTAEQVRAMSLKMSLLGLLFTAHKRREHDAGVIKTVTLRKLLTRTKSILKLTREVWKIDADVRRLEPEHCNLARLAIISRYPTPDSRDSYLRHLSSMFKFAMDMRYIDAPVPTGGFLGGTTKRERRAFNAARELDEGKRFIPAEEVRERLGDAGRFFVAVVALGINVGFGGEDIRQLKRSWIELHESEGAEPWKGRWGLVDYHRHKTGTRRFLVLWPETLDAINLNGGVGEYAIATRTGRRWSSQLTSKLWRDQTKRLNLERAIKQRPALRDPSRHYDLRHTGASVCPEEHRKGWRYLAGQEVGDVLDETYVHDRDRMIAAAKNASEYLWRWLYGDASCAS